MLFTGVSTIRLPKRIVQKSRESSGYLAGYGGGRIRNLLCAGLWSAVLLAPAALAQSTWTELSPGGSIPPARTGAPAVYDSVNNRMIVFGGRDASGANLNDVRVLTNANGAGSHPAQWIKLIPNGAAGSPPARSGHSAVYDSVNNRLIVFGGCAGYCAPVLNDVWVLTNANGLGGTPAWNQLTPLGTPPPARANAAATFDGLNLIIFGGQDGSANPCSTFSDVWTLHYVAGPTELANWSLDPVVAGSPIPAGQNGAAAVMLGSQLIVFGGMGLVNGTCQATNAVSRLLASPEEYSWVSVVPEGASDSPSARSFASAVYDSKGNWVIAFGGVDGSGTYLNDAWDLPLTSVPKWSKISPTGGPPAAREGQAAIFDAASRRMTIFGGKNAAGVLNDTWTLFAPGVAELSCYAGGGLFPSSVRAESAAEPVGDVVLYCTGGTPTPAGQPIPEYEVTVTLNTNITSRLLPQAAGLSEALLFIDEPYPAAPNPPPPYSVAPPPGTPSQILCTPLGSHCGETGTGGTPNPYLTQPNVFVGRQISANTLSWKIPIDAPGVNGAHLIRMTNLRANASQLGVPSGMSFNTLEVTLSLQGSRPIPLAPNPLIVAYSSPGVTATIPTTASIPQCTPHNPGLLGGSGSAGFDFSIQAVENLGIGFKSRNFGNYFSGPVFPPVLEEQNLTNYYYHTETGFYSPSLFTAAPTLGLADFGTRILVSFGSVSAGTKLFVPTTITMTGNYGTDPFPPYPGQLQLVEAGPSGNSAPGYVPVASTATIGTTPVAEASRSGSAAYAVYEVTYSNPGVVETASIPVAVAFTNTPAIGTVNADTSLAPLSTVGTASESAPIPRFANFSSAQPAYSITACAAVNQ
jgi:hypothetical protein